nr:AhpC/TSA family protein [uncultured Allomuricauda sp.]
MQKLLIIGTLFIGLLSCKDDNVVEFSLLGKTNGIENGTVLFLKNQDTKETVDSTVVYENRFLFNTKLPKSPIRFFLHDKNFSNKCYLWLENNSMTFDASKSDFKNAIVKGSESEILQKKLYAILDTISRPSWLKYEMDFVKNNPSSIVSARLLSLYSTTIGKEKTKKLFEQFSVENKTSEYGQKIARYIKLNKNPKIGDNYVDFEMTDQKGNINKLSNYDGKIVLLEFWASWCTPCRQENPNLVKTYENFKQKGFEVFAVSIDNDKSSWLKAIEKDNLNWKHVSDLNGNGNSAGLIYGVNGIPDNFLIDTSGKIIARNLRGEKLNEKLDELLN